MHYIVVHFYIELLITIIIQYSSTDKGIMIYCPKISLQNKDEQYFFNTE